MLVLASSLKRECELALNLYRSFSVYITKSRLVIVCNVNNLYTFYFVHSYYEEERYIHMHIVLWYEFLHAHVVFSALSK